ncbi:ribonuclease E inhibitor RraB [Sphingomonas abietis]|uniref:Ribonuclease E inhibitor RraB n=1 Tax=Sphingomonas abietis TaxID=3012344 RepID=A0ABY7NIB8_9SPHN|nr:ribonuclease E inhibitor RraB [Sphingomonas abietis]WBO21266.1 ribonuclease E inhibitor RraB [Sphingomonas abietis]
MPNANTPIDEARFEQEWEQDQELLAQLATNGDDASVVRLVDVSFVGDMKDLEPVAEAAESHGFAFGQLVPDEEGDEPDVWRLDLDVEQTIEPDAIRALTRKCLEIEASFPGIEYDGWGCMAVTGADD